MWSTLSTNRMRSSIAIQIQSRSTRVSPARVGVGLQPGSLTAPPNSRHFESSRSWVRNLSSARLSSFSRSPRVSAGWPARSLSSRLRQEAQEPDHEVGGLAALHEKGPKTQLQTTTLAHPALDTADCVRHIAFSRKSYKLKLNVRFIRFLLNSLIHVQSQG